MTKPQSTPDTNNNSEADTPAAHTSKPETEAPVSIIKPGAFDLDKFKSKRAAALENVATLLTALPVIRPADAKDYFRLHPDEVNYLSHELCFVGVPIKGQKGDNLHLIDEELGMRYLPAARIRRFRLALATKPFDVFFLAQVPTQNLDNSWNYSSRQACDHAKTLWTEVVSRKAEGAENYQIRYARSQKAFPEPRWPTQTLSELIAVSFPNRIIESEDHPGLLRLLGAEQRMS
jgi:hypothetical protein